MLDKGLMGHSIVAILSVSMAYVAWRAPSNADPVQQRIVVIDGAPEQLTAVLWDDPEHHVQLARQADGGMIATIQPVPKEGTPQEPATSFPASPQLHLFLEKLAPLQAARLLGPQTDEQLKMMGLQPATQTLTLTTAHGKQSVVVGNITYGSGDFYARRADGVVFLLPATVIAPLRYGAKSLQDRRLIRVNKADIATVVISAQHHQREISQRLGDDPQRAYFADPAEPDHKLEHATRWMNALLELSVANVPPMAPAATPPAITVVVQPLTGKPITVALWPSDGSIAQAKASQYAEPVAVSKIAADNVLREIDEVMQEGN